MFRMQVKFIFVMLLFSVTAHALPTDAKEKLLISADSWKYNYKTGINEYEGNVTVDQGSTHIRADRLITKSDLTHKIEEATAFGVQKSAHFWTLQKAGEAEIHAHAKIIKFYPKASNTILEDDVLVTQADNSFRGQVIHYNGNDETIIVPASSKGRAVIVYNPDSK